MHLAGIENHIDVVEILLKSRADPKPSDVEGDMPIHWAATKGHKDVSISLSSTPTFGMPTALSLCICNCFLPLPCHYLPCHHLPTHHDTLSCNPPVPSSLHQSRCLTLSRSPTQHCSDNPQPITMAHQPPTHPSRAWCSSLHALANALPTPHPAPPDSTPSHDSCGQDQ